MKALGYIRRSQESGEKTISLAVQESEIVKFCQRQRLELLQPLISHDGISGTKRSRFAEIERVVKESKPDCLVLYNLDRLARDVAGLMDYLRSLAKRHIKVFEVGQGEIDITQSRQKITIGVRGLMDEFYADVIGEKTTDALRRLREQGRQYSRIPPLGWRYENGVMVADAEEQRALAILERCGQLGMGARRAQQELDAAGYRGRNALGMLHKILAASKSKNTS